MNKQHPARGTGSGTSATDASTSEAHPSHSPSDSPPKRQRGRPAVGQLVQVRMSDSVRELAVSLGEGTLAKGVRVALDLVAVEQASAAGGLLELRDLLGALQSMAKDLGKEQLDAKSMLQLIHELRVAAAESADTKPSSKIKKTTVDALGLVKLSTADTAFARELGEGDVEHGMQIAVGAARFLGIETARKMTPHGTGSAK